MISGIPPYDMFTNSRSVAVESVEGYDHPKHPFQPYTNEIAFPLGKSLYESPSVLMLDGDRYEGIF